MDKFNYFSNIRNYFYTIREKNQLKEYFFFVEKSGTSISCLRFQHNQTFLIQVGILREITYMCIFWTQVNDDLTPNFFFVTGEQHIRMKLI
jgi:hypothetical protein